MVKDREDVADDIDNSSSRRYPSSSTTTAVGKRIFVTVVVVVLVLTVSIATIGGSASIMQAANAVEPPLVGKITPKLPPRLCTTSLSISSPTNGASYFENERGPGNDGLVTIKFSGSAYNPCRPVFTNLNWYLDGRFLGSGAVVYKTLFAGCESYTTHTATLVATFQKPPAKATASSFMALTTTAPPPIPPPSAANSMSKSVSFTTGAVC